MASTHCSVLRTRSARRPCLGEPIEIGDGPLPITNKRWKDECYTNSRTIVETLAEIMRPKRRRFVVMTIKEISERANDFIRRHPICASEMTPDIAGKAMNLLGFVRVERCASTSRWMVPRAQALELYEKLRG